MTTHTLDLHLERLERRQMLDGNVNVVLTAAGDLRVTGDNQSNEVFITSGLTDFTIQPGSDTSINGGAAGQSVTIRNDGLRDLKVNMRGGDDLIYFGNQVTLLATRFRHGVINGGAGNDYVDFNSANAGEVRFSGNLKVVLAGGAARSQQYSGAGQVVALDDVTVDRNLTVLGGVTRDFVEVLGTTVEGNSVFNVGAGTDVLSFKESTRFGGRVVVNAGGAADRLRLGTLHAEGQFRVNGGAGEDKYTTTVDTDFDFAPIFRSIERDLGVPI